LSETLIVQPDKQEKEFHEKVVQIRRVTKVVKGGKRMGFRAVVVIGDEKARVGIGMGKAGEVSAAIRKGVESAKKKVKFVNLFSGTIPHEVIGRFSASEVILRPAPKGTGVIAGGAVRVMLELAGLKNVVAKSVGSNNAINLAKATLNALLALRLKEEEEKIRGKGLEIKNV
jgi:small subunit ribosomal protein S5